MSLACRLFSFCQWIKTVVKLASECLGVWLQLLSKVAATLHQFKTFVTSLRATIAVAVSLSAEAKLALRKNYQLLEGLRSDQD